jgi:hypothetical protein
MNINFDYIYYFKDIIQVKKFKNQLRKIIFIQEKKLNFTIIAWTNKFQWDDNSEFIYTKWAPLKPTPSQTTVFIR